MIAENLKNIQSTIPSHVELIAVSKTKPIELLMEAYEAGQRHFGENKVQEMVQKYDALPKDISWHLIGHLQTNKVKYIAHFVHLIHAIDSLKLLVEVNKQAKKHNRIINCLLQFHIAQEDSKFGLSWDEAISLLQSAEYSSMKNVHISGVMGMASYTSNTDYIRNEFSVLKGYFDDLKKNYFAQSSSFDIVSMGMSNDYEIAIEQGSTMVRIGSSIFGER